MEKPGITGISHLLEHMMFKGTEQYAKGEIDYITTRHGGSNNAFTSRDYTAYYFSFASDRWHPALEIEADRMVNAVSILRSSSSRGRWCLKNSGWTWTVHGAR